MESIEFVEIGDVFIKTDRIQGNMVILKQSEEDSQYFLMFVGDAEITAIAKEKGAGRTKAASHTRYLPDNSQAYRSDIRKDRNLGDAREHFLCKNLCAHKLMSRLPSMRVRATRWRWRSTKNAPLWSTRSCSGVN